MGKTCPQSQNIIPNLYTVRDFFLLLLSKQSTMEQLLHYVWKHKMFPLEELRTSDGETVEVIDAGLHNNNSGPDFLNAKIKIDGTLWAGSVEIHCKSRDWYTHGHDRDAAYDNTVLHVASLVDTEVKTSSGRTVPQLQLDVPPRIAQNFAELIATDHYPPCYKVIPDIEKMKVHSWMNVLQTERLEQKTADIMHRVERCDGSWEDACFVTLARNCGFGINGDAFEEWAFNLGLHSIAHHRDDIFQIEACFMGQAGLLETDAVPERYRDAALREGYFTRLRNEYLYLAHKFGLKPIDVSRWRFLRLRPQNFPHIRISQLANLYFNRRAGLSAIIDCDTTEQLRSMFATCVTPYWETHYVFGGTSHKTEKHLSTQSANLLIINTAVPMLFAYGRHKQDERLCDKALRLLEQVAAENNHIVRMWRACGLEVANAGDSQALIQLKKEYCDRKDCLRCRFGYEYLKNRYAPTTAG